MRERGALVVLSNAALFEATDDSTPIESPLKDEFNESVYGSHFASEPLPERIMPEKEMSELTKNCLLVSS